MPTALLAASKFAKDTRITALSGSRDTFPGTLLVLTLPGFPRRGILAEPLRTRRSSSPAHPQCRSLPPDASPGFRSSRVSEIRVTGQHIQLIAVCASHAPRNGGRCV
ncbi:hypothetical protein NDU88_001408 [Pleurodeles waltl]|uniref:Uncharacterized protein n=1 Tax=Pleurodeles waltl TaxID=8319 RepID=A0AAV7UU89_PLEWA|nr:hypothetical protein NDU88_001408 [Pleurodeles waltl]